MANEESQAEQVAEPQPQSETKPAEVGTNHAAAKQPEIGATYKGRVRSMVDFGAFVDIGAGRDGLVHISALKRAGVDKTLHVGDTVEVIVKRVDPADNRISLVLPGAETDTRAGKQPLAELKAGATVNGKVVRLADFGAFIDIGAQADGLLHVSELPWGYVNKPSEVLKVGDEIKVRILEVDPRKQHISLSMRQTQVDVEPEPSAQDENNEPLPTAFEMAFQKAKQQQRRQQARTRR